MRLLDFINPFKIYKRAAMLQGMLDARDVEIRSHIAQMARLEKQIDKLEAERQRLIDWLLKINGAPALIYSGDLAPAEIERVVTQPPAIQPPQNQLSGIRQGRDWVRTAEAIEAEAFAN